jgi:hypothetical protein
LAAQRGLLAVAALSAIVAACATPEPTPVPTAIPLPTVEPTLAPPTEPPTEAASPTAEATATELPPTAAPTRPPQAAAQPAASKVPPAPPAPAYDVKWWADQPRMPKDLGCTQINWEVTGGKEVWLRWPNQDEQKVEAKGRQEGVCLNEGERAVFTLRVVRQDGTSDIREMALERDD